MRHLLALFAFALLTVTALGHSIAAPPPTPPALPDGTLISSEPCPPNSAHSYDDFLADVRKELASEAEEARSEGIQMPTIGEARLRAALPTPPEVRERLAYSGFECRVITYASEGLKIGGLLWKPLDTRGKRLPLVIALRGGRSNYGAMEPWRYWGWYDFLKAGYVVLASQYRGGPGSEGADGFGSRGDLQDVRNLVPLARNLGYVDTDQLFLHGGSRGGMQAYMLARSGFPARAIAIRAGLANIRRSFQLRPKLAVPTQRIMTDYAADPEAALDARSAALWAHELKVPSIIFHGTDDWRAPVQDALDVANGLSRAGKPFELHLYEADTHSMNLNQADMIRRTIAFFDRRRSLSLSE